MERICQKCGIRDCQCPEYLFSVIHDRDAEIATLKELLIKKDDGFIRIPRAIAEEAIRTKVSLPNELYDAIKEGLR